MECTSKRSKRDQWTERFARFERSEQTVRKFCRDEGVSVPSFYEWKRKLHGGTGNSRLRGVASPRPTREAGNIASAFKPVLVTPFTQTLGVTIRLPHGIVVELGPDRATIEQVIQQLLTHAVTVRGESC